jgi:hypothetical protein
MPGRGTDLLKARLRRPGIVDQVPIQRMVRQDGSRRKGLNMGTDTKLGLVVGVVVVMAVAVIYFPKGAQTDRTASVVPSLPAAGRAADTALLPSGPTAATRFDPR